MQSFLTIMDIIRGFYERFFKIPIKLAKLKRNMFMMSKPFNSLIPIKYDTELSEG